MQAVTTRASGLLPSSVLKASSTHGRYGALKLNKPRNDMFTYSLRRPWHGAI